MENEWQQMCAGLCICCVIPETEQEDPMKMEVKAMTGAQVLRTLKWPQTESLMFLVHGMQADRREVVLRFL